MNINATFFIQLCHFLIGYFILERLLLRPWFNVIKYEAQQKHEQENLLKIAQQQVALKEQFKKEQWQEFQIIFAQTMPYISMEPEFFKARPLQTLSPVTIKTDRHNAFQKEVEQSLLARLTHE